MDYAIAISMDDMAFCSQKKIPKENIFPANQTPALVEKLQTGDCVSINNIAIFPSVEYFWTFCQRLTMKEVKLKILQQPRLEFGGEKCWKMSVRRYVDSVRYAETQIPAEICRTFRLNASGQDFVRRWIQYWMIRMLAETFLKDGILSRN